MEEQKVVDSDSPQVAEVASKAVGLIAPVDLLKNAWSLYKSRLRVFIGIVLLPFLLMLGIGVVSLFIFGFMSVFVLPESASLEATNVTSGIGGGNMLITVILIVLAIVVVVSMFIVQVWGQVALVVAVKDSSEAIGVRESFKRSRSKILSYWWVMFLMGLIVMGGYMLFFIPGLIFGVWFSLALYVLVSEDVRGMNALLKSREYVRGRWWAVFGRFLFVGLVSFMVYVVPSILFELLELSFIGSIYSWLVSLVLSPMVVIYSFLLYKNIKSVKGSFEFTPTGRSKVAFIIVGILGFLVIPIIFIAIILVAINPAERMLEARDVARANDQLSIKYGLDMYFIDNSVYPDGLDQLVPEYFPQVPKDPSSDLEYEYVQLEGGASYELCVEYEVKARECIGPSSDLEGAFPTYPYETYPPDKKYF